MSLFRDALKARVERNEEVPAIPTAADGGLAKYALLQVGIANALPELVRKGDDKLLERGRDFTPSSVGKRYPCNGRCNACRQKHALSCRFVRIAWPDQLGEVLNLSSVVENHADPDEAVVKRDGVLAEARDEDLRGLANQLDVSEQVSGSAEACKKSSSVLR
jgi:hypothetical protein